MVDVKHSSFICTKYFIYLNLFCTPTENGNACKVAIIILEWKKEFKLVDHPLWNFCWKNEEDHFGIHLQGVLLQLYLKVKGSLSIVSDIRKKDSIGHKNNLFKVKFQHPVHIKQKYIISGVEII